MRKRSGRMRSGVAGFACALALLALRGEGVAQSLAEFGMPLRPGKAVATPLWMCCTMTFPSGLP
jgi:hypothetical protein